MNSAFKLSPIALACLLIHCAPAHAQTSSTLSESNTEAAPTKELGTVVIQGIRLTSLPTHIPTTIEGITREELEKTINATDSEDALKYLPSLLVRKRYIGDYNHAVLSTRASGTGNSARSAVYADGILLSNYLGNGANFAPRWGLVTPDEIERVDVLYGPFSAVYGGNSVGAVVDYQTRMPNKFEAHIKFGYSKYNFDLYNTHDSFGHKQLSVGFGNKVNAWSFYVDVNRNDSNGHPQTFITKTAASSSPSGAGKVVSGAWLSQDRAYKDWYLLGSGTQYHTVQDQFKAKIAYDFAPGLRATYTAAIWKNDSKNRAKTYLTDSTGTPIYSGAIKFGDKNYTLGATDFGTSNEGLTHFMHGISLMSRNRGEWDWTLAASQFKYQDDVLRASGVALPNALNGGTGRIVNGSGTGWRTLNARALYRPTGSQHAVELGYQQEAYRLATKENATDNWLSGAAGALNSAFGGETQIDALFLQDTWRFAPAWKAVLGVRAERWNAQDGYTSNSKSTVNHQARSETTLSPKAAIAFQASEDLVLKASLGHAIRFPTVSELYQGGINAQGILINNDPRLKPEKSWTSELSAEHVFSHGVARVTTFAERTEDALYSQTNVTVTPNVTNIQNVDLINTRGLEAAITLNNVLTQGFDFSASLTWTHSKIDRNIKFPASVGKWQPRIPEWRATAVASYRLNDQWDASLGARYSGKQFSTLDNSDPNGFAYQGASKYFTADMRINYRYNKQWRASFGIDNLNNYQYWNFHPYPQRTFIAEVKFDY